MTSPPPHPRPLGGTDRGQDALDDGDEEVVERVPLVHLVDDQVGDACQRGLCLQSLQQHTRGAEQDRALLARLAAADDDSDQKCTRMIVMLVS